jgi:hypothetical protein
MCKEQPMANETLEQFSKRTAANEEFEAAFRAHERIDFRFAEVCSESLPGEETRIEVSDDWNCPVMVEGQMHDGDIDSGIPTCPCVVTYLHHPDKPEICKHFVELFDYVRPDGEPATTYVKCAYPKELR